MTRDSRPPAATPSRQRLAGLVAALSLAPGQPPRQVRVVDALDHARRCMAAEDFASAVHIGEQLRRVTGATTAAFVLLLEAMVMLGRPGDALTVTQRLLALGVEDPADVLTAARGLQLTNRHGQAIELLDKALARAPRDVNLLHCRAELLGEAGDHAKAVADLRKVVALDPKFFPAYRSLALIDGLTDEDVRFLETATIPEAGRAAVCSALAFAWRARGDVAREFTYLDQAHALLARSDPWFPAEETEMADQVIAQLDRGFFARQPALAASGGRRPIFVIGMPRSGSTLAEQILVSAEGVGTTGESGLFPWVLLDLAQRRYGEPPFPEIALRLEPRDLGSLRSDYLALVERVYTPAPVFVDKQFTNWKFAGLLRLVFPEALFVHTVRDPLDTCLSTYQQAFPSLGYGHDIGHVAQLLKDQARVMAHWRSHFPERIHTLEYEKLVASPEAEIRALLGFCGIPWTDRALNFHETRRGIKTASVMQVRRPIYTTSVHKWRAYERFLAPAKRVLEG